MVDSKRELETLRKQINEIDDTLERLISERAKIAVEVGNIKKAAGEKALYYRPEREAQILQRMIKNNRGPLSDKAITEIFRTIISTSLALQRPMTIAFLGPEGTFSHAGALKYFGESINILPVDSIKKVFHSVEAESANYGIIPIENSTQGVVNTTLDSFMESSLKICGEIELPIHQCLLVDPDDGLPIQRIYSHQQSLFQCEKWLDAHFAKADRVAVSSNAHAAELAKEEKGAAAIAGELCGPRYGLITKAENIEDDAKNTTRFLIIGQQQPEPSGSDKTSLIITTTNRPGSLAHLMLHFSQHDINLTLIESRPYRSQMWSYLFFLDFEGHRDDQNVKAALEALSKEPIMMNILGSYPRAIA